LAWIERAVAICSMVSVTVLVGIAEGSRGKDSLVAQRARVQSITPLGERQLFE
jgi:hypothetical protein